MRYNTNINMKFILGKKLGMSQLFSEGGEVVPVTLVEAGPCKVLQIKTKEKDGYEAIQVGFEQLKEKKVKKSLKEPCAARFSPTDSDSFLSIEKKLS